VLLGNDGSSVFKVEVNNGGLYAESAAIGKSLLNSLETAIESTTQVPPYNPDVWDNIDDFLETAQLLQHAELNPSTSDSIRPYTSSSSRASSELLHDHTSAGG
jgi:hypothetical protein